jgi:Flp pilus assembly protein TadD
MALGGVIAWSNAYGVRSYEIAQITVNTGALERQAGHHASAIERFRRGLEMDATDEVAWTELALTLEESGQTAQAGTVWLEALSRMPNNPMLRQHAALYLKRQRER